jgi:hypothetical protein
MKHARVVRIGVLSLMLASGSVLADTVIYNNDFPDGKVGSTSGSSNGLETETADDFSLSTLSQIKSGSFTGLIPQGASITSVGIEIYRVFPLDSTNPPNPVVVPTRNNSPSDVAFREQPVSFTTSLLSNNVGTANSVVNNISPGSTGGEGGKNGQEVRVDFTASGLTLPADHYFFVPQVELSNGTFLWLSAPKPAGGEFGSTAISPDLQAWVRNQNLDPNWLRIGTDIIGADPGAQQYNMAFRLVGETVVVPEPTPIAMLIAGLLGVAAWSQRKRDRLA